MARYAKLLLLGMLALLLVLPTAACGRDRPEDEAATETTDTEAFAEEDLSGTIRADGSSTVGPYVTYAAEQFQKEEPGVRITVGVSGTGGGFERFCRGETDLSNASRPIDEDEAKICEDKGIDYTELQIANDGLSVVVNPNNNWADCLTVDQLKKIWAPGSKVDNWKDVDSSFPNVKLTLYGAGTDSGTFDYFTDAIVGEEGASRSDYTATEDDNVTVTGVAGERGALGYFGLSYLETNRSKVKGVEIDGGDGCVAPTTDTVQNGTYTPLSRPLFAYVKSSELERVEVDAFLQYIVENQERIAKAALFVPLTEDQVSKSQTQLEAGSTDVE
jgi:phosphate transport system substrate-binding protein